MKLSAEQMQFLADRGMSIAEVIEFASMGVARSAGAERQARYRERMDVSNAEWNGLRAIVFERDGFECVYCRSDVDLACDHVTPLIQGGKSTLDNLVTACRRCNSAKAGRTPEEWRA